MEGGERGKKGWDKGRRREEVRKGREGKKERRERQGRLSKARGSSWKECTHRLIVATCWFI